MRGLIISFLCGMITGAVGLHLIVIAYYGKGRING